jgi:hypothetical protein
MLYSSLGHPNGPDSLSHASAQQVDHPALVAPHHARHSQELIRPSRNTFFVPFGPWRAAARWARRKRCRDADCWFDSLYIRAVPSHAIELAAVYLDRSVAAVLAYAPDMTASPQEKQDLAALIHLCGAGSARGFVRRGFQVMAGERCGDYLVTTFLTKINAMKRQFLRLAVNNQN